MKPMSCKCKVGQRKSFFIVTHEFKNIKTTALYPPVMGIFRNIKEANKFIDLVIQDRINSGYRTVMDRPQATCRYIDTKGRTVFMAKNEIEEWIFADRWKI